MVARLVVQTFLWFGAMAVLLFSAAGTLNWPGAWAFLAEMVGLSLVSGSSLARHDPALLEERLRPLVQKDQMAADKVLMSLFLLLVILWLVFMGLDAVRFAWSSVPLFLQALGALCLFICVAIGYRVMRENSFAAPVVKIQTERRQTVITTGPYRHVRHPMYAGALFFFVGTPLLLGSWWGLAFALALTLLLCVRIPIEEKALRAGLQGYDDYAARVRYRLIPLIW
ncbi:Protein-S-isoprenylcysteine O-methyltransferase Ste14 [Rhizobiales bacterium GAS191]|nr:Protein-S-isoprenylcysteine O-methyltransferase Ste14 [Rhizobiales bacterium GAS191]